MNGLCAPSVMNLDDELEFLQAEKIIIDRRILEMRQRQNEETGISKSTMDDVRIYFIEYDVECYIDQTWWDLSYKEIIEFVSEYNWSNEDCIDKMLKEHTNHILLSR